MKKAAAEFSIPLQTKNREKGAQSNNQMQKAVVGSKLNIPLQTKKERTHCKKQN
jgi:hypothetical protein